jgi:hypothetical protein
MPPAALISARDQDAAPVARASRRKAPARARQQWIRSKGLIFLRSCFEKQEITGQRGRIGDVLFRDVGCTGQSGFSQPYIIHDVFFIKGARAPDRAESKFSEKQPRQSGVRFDAGGQTMNGSPRA